MDSFFNNLKNNSNNNEIENNQIDIILNSCRSKRREILIDFDAFDISVFRNKRQMYDSFDVSGSVPDVFH